MILQLLHALAVEVGVADDDAVGADQRHAVPERAPVGVGERVRVDAGGPVRRDHLRLARERGHRFVAAGAASELPVHERTPSPARCTPTTASAPSRTRLVSLTVSRAVGAFMRYPNPRTVSMSEPAGSQLGAQALDVHVDGARLDVRRRFPDRLEQVRAAERAAAALGERAQEAELGGGELHLVRRDPDAVRGAVDPDRPGDEHVAGVRRRRARGGESRRRAARVSCGLNGLVR